MWVSTRWTRVNVSLDKWLSQPQSCPHIRQVFKPVNLNDARQLHFKLLSISCSLLTTLHQLKASACSNLSFTHCTLKSTQSNYLILLLYTYRKVANTNTSHLRTRILHIAYISQNFVRKLICNIFLGVKIYYDFSQFLNCSCEIHYHQLLHQQFLQNLEKDLIPTIMHTTAHRYVLPVSFPVDLLLWQ